MARILVVDDDESVRDAVRDGLKDVGHEVDTAKDETEASGLIQTSDYEVVVADMVMQSKEGGLDVLRQAKSKDALTQVIVLTAYGSVDNAVKAMEAGAFTYLEKRGKDPSEIVLLRNQVDRAAAHRSGMVLAADATRAFDEAARTLDGVVSEVEKCSALLATAARARKDLLEGNKLARKSEA